MPYHGLNITHSLVLRSRWNCKNKFSIYWNVSALFCILTRDHWFDYHKVMQKPLTSRHQRKQAMKGQHQPGDQHLPWNVFWDENSQQFKLAEIDSYAELHYGTLWIQIWFKRLQYNVCFKVPDQCFIWFATCRKLLTVLLLYIDAPRCVINALCPIVVLVCDASSTDLSEPWLSNHSSPYRHI